MEPSARSATAVDKAGERTVTVVRRSDCSHGPLAIEAISRLVGQLRLAVRIEDVVIGPQGDAEAQRCLGSPTVLIAGVDVEPAARGRTDSGAT